MWEFSSWTGPEGGDPAVELRHTGHRPPGSSRRGHTPARVDPGQADGLIPLPAARSQITTHGDPDRAREEEIEPLTRLFIRARNEMDYLPAVPAEAAEPIAARIREHEEVWVAEEDGRLLGFLGIEHSTNLGAPVLEKLYVEPAEQNRGVGSALLDKSKELPPGRSLPVGLPEECGRSAFLRAAWVPAGRKLTDGSGNMEREPDARYEWTSAG